MHKVAEVMNPHIVEPGALADAPPGSSSVMGPCWPMVNQRSLLATRVWTT